jgi:thermostable 8-oxoguanine DNA glycosylase
MIKPSEITNFNRTRAELEAFLLFVPMVAGKNSDIQALKLNKFLECLEVSPFEYVEWLIKNDNLEWKMRRLGFGQYGRLLRSYKDIIKLDPRTCTIDDLEGIHGIGLKSSRFFVVHSREGARHSVIDTHILKYLRDNGVEHKGKTTPTSPKIYAELEQKYLDLADKSGMSVADHDLWVWKTYRTK